MPQEAEQVADDGTDEKRHRIPADDVHDTQVCDGDDDDDEQSEDREHDFEFDLRALLDVLAEGPDDSSDVVLVGGEEFFQRLDKLVVLWLLLLFVIAGHEGGEQVLAQSSFAGSVNRV